MSRGGATGVGAVAIASLAIAIAATATACVTHAAPVRPRAPAAVATGDAAHPALAMGDAEHAAEQRLDDQGGAHVHGAVEVHDHVSDDGAVAGGLAVGGGLGTSMVAIDVAPRPAPPESPAPEPPPEAPLDDGLGGAAPVKGYDVPGYVAFTFDDGPHPAWTPRVLAALAAHDVHATFFVVGRNIWGLDHPARRRELAAIAAAGHDLGNHTWDHARLTEVGPLARAHQIDDTGALIRWITGRPVTMVRPPYGASDPTLVAFLRKRGLTQVGWNLDPRDWETHSPAALRKRAVDVILRAGGGILILHDDKWITAQALPGILDDLEAANCRRLAGGLAPILPVSLHYFTGRAVPAWVEARTRAYRDGLTSRCAARADEAR